MISAARVAVKVRASIPTRGTVTEAALSTTTTSTPDALWSSRAVRALRPTAVSCRDITRRVGRRRLLDRCTLDVPVGVRLLLVAEPEASATLLLRVLGGLARAKGHVALAGVEAGPDGWAGRVAYVGADPGLYPWMLPREALRLAADLAGFHGADARRRVDEIAARHGLTSVIDRPMTRGGPPLLQRVALAAALLGEPEVLLLDDPLRAVEPDLRARLLAIPGPRRTVIIASRYPASEAGLVSHLALLREGRVALIAPLRALAERGLPLSQRGIATLAEEVVSSPAAATRPPAPGGRS